MQISVKKKNIFVYIFKTSKSRYIKKFITKVHKSKNKKKKLIKFIVLLK